VVKEGVIIRDGASGKPEVVILGFIPSDQRRLNYNFVFGLSLTVMRLRKAWRPPAIPPDSILPVCQRKILGKDIVTRLTAFKNKHDPKFIMNPGKVIKGGMISRAMTLARAMEPLIRPLGNRVFTHPGERPGQTGAGIRLISPGMPMAVLNADTV